MNLEKYPLEKETDFVLLTRLSEECSEVIKAVSKMIRFGNKKRNIKDMYLEMDDVNTIFKEVKKRFKNE